MVVADTLAEEVDEVPYDERSYGRQIDHISVDSRPQLASGFWVLRLLTDGEHMLEVIRYIPLNPVRADLCAEPEAWPWSSYAATLGLVPRPAFLCTSWTLALFSSDVRNARERLHLWVESGSTKRPRGV